MEKRLVAVSPSYGSKINWTQIASIVVTVAVYFGLDVTAEQVVSILVGITVAFDVITIIWRTWFTGSTPTTAQVEVMAADKGLIAVAPAETKNPVAAKAEVKRVKKNWR